MSAAYFLHKNYDITLYEKSNYLGGHAHAIEIDYNGKKFLVDTAVMIFDRQNYPNFEKLLKSIGISESDKEQSDVSWGASFENSGLEYSNRSPLRQWNNVLSFRSWKIFFHYTRFIWLSRRAFVKNPKSLESQTFGKYLRDLRVSKDCIDHIITPLYGCIFSLTPEEILAWPTHTMLGFLYRQQMMNVGLTGETTWHMLRGSTREYVERLTRPFQNAVRLNTSIASVRRTDGKVAVSFADGTEEIFDKIVLATHANEALQLLAEPTPDEKALLGAFPYTRNRKLIVHNDERVMPKRKSCWASFTCNDRLRALDGGLALTYWMNLIYNIDQQYPLFISINTDAVAPERRFAEMEYSHPAFTADSYQAQKELHRLPGVGGIYYCGSYFGYACHEDAVESSMAISDLLGGDIPWKK